MRFARPRLAVISTALLCSVSVLAPLPGGLPASGVRPTPSGVARPVTPEVQEVSVPEADRPQVPTLAAKSVPRSAEGYAVVGATWLGRPPRGLRLTVRSRDGGSWSAWTELHRSHGRDASSLKARRVRRGTDPLAVGEVDAVQLRATSATGTAPRDLELSVIDPGRSASDGDADGDAVRLVHTVATADVASNEDVEVAGVRAPRPYIRSRAAWGADDRMRSSSPQYGRVTAGFVHHTVNVNRYTRADVPAILRGIYAYHTQSLGWSDIGYNFVIDRFGRKWVGRAGGPRRAVIGAQVYGYNHLSTGIATIGNFETSTPPMEMQRAVGRMLAWKLGLHGVRVGGRMRWMEGERFRAVNGHRDAGATACPGIKLYRRLPDIREIAIRWQQR